MNSPCKECIVTSMCEKACHNLINFMPNIMELHGVNLDYNNYVNKRVLDYLADDIREGFVSKGPHHYFCIGLKNELLSLYIEQKGGKIMKLRIENEEPL